MKTLVAVLLIAASPAMADSSVLMNTYGGAAAGPAPVSLMMSMHVDDNHDLLMMAIASDPAGVTSVSILGNGKVIALCQAPTCRYLWPRKSMRSGMNTVTLQFVNVTGTKREAFGHVDKPAAK